MSETKFTPGPWIADGTLVYADIGIQPYITDTRGFTDEPKANANLISAAPDMYEALKAAILEYGKPGGTWIDKAKAAVVKARGEL